MSPSGFAVVHLLRNSFFFNGLINSELWFCMFQILDDQKEPVRGILRALSSGFLAVVQLQLKVVLQEGR